MNQIFGILLAFCFSGAYVPQVYKIVKNRSSRDVSFLMLVVNGIGYSSGLLYVYLSRISGFWLKFNYWGGLIMTILCILIWFRYKDK